MFAFASVIGVLAVATGCRSVGGANAGDSVLAARDTVRGVLSVVGAEPLTALVLAPSGGGASLALEGAQELMMRGLSRIEVMAAGRRTTRRSSTSPSELVFEVDSFVVRAADGVAAHDGIVGVDAGRYFLVRGDARVAAAFMPDALRQLVGARVFLVGPLDAAPIAYGVIGDRR